MKSSLYIGLVGHRRFSPRAHAFKYNVAMFNIDLSEVDQIFRIPFLLSKKPGLLQFRRSDYYGDPSRPIDICIRELVESRTGEKATGPIRLLTQLRYLGICFNPVSFYYCYDEAGEHLQFIVAEITNTPWNERHCYVMKCDGRDFTQVFQLKKEFHVSPFLPMDMNYSWGFTKPDKTIVVHMENFSPETLEKVFDATMNMNRYPLTTFSVAKIVASFPLLTMKTILAIYWQALLLKLKGTPFFDHPSTVTEETKL
jgi:DUF1365 family protein